MTVDTAAGLSLVDEDVLTAEMKTHIEPCTGVTLSCASNTRVQPLGQISLYVRLHDLIVPFYFGAMRNFPPKLLTGTAFCDRHIVTITPALKQIIQKNSRPLQILAFNNDTISAIQTPHPLTPHQTAKEHVNLLLTVPITIEPYSQRLVPFSAPVYGLFTIENHPHLYNSLCCRLANGIVQVGANKTFHVWVLNTSDKPKTFPTHIRVVIITTAPSVIHHQTKIDEDADPQEKESLEDNTLDLKTKPRITVDTLATLKGMRIRDLAKSLNHAVDDHYRTQEKQDKEVEADWRTRINVGNPFEKYKQELIKRLEKFSSMWDGHLGTIRAT